MKAKSTRKLVFAFSLIVLTVLSCSSPMQLFATPTATFTSTFTPTNTPTPTATSTPTATPVPPPPFVLESCVFAEDCPEAVLVYDYLPESMETNVLTRVDFPFEDKVRMNIGWCAIDDAALKDNVEHITYIFEIDGISYLDRATIKPGVVTDEVDATIEHPCTFISAVGSGWTIGENHQVTIGYKFDDTIFDGWETYGPFTNTYMMDLNPSFMPTPTPTATPRPLPTIPYSTPVPACDASSSIEISNTTGGQVTLYLNGPANYTYNLGTGGTTLYVCPGEYSYTAYGCGGASDSGYMYSGEAHEFYCSG